MKERKKNTGSCFYSNNPQMTTIRPNANDRYPNDNLFKTDKRYKMNKYLEFDSNDEQSFQQIQNEIFTFKIEHLSFFCFLRIFYQCGYTSLRDYYKGAYYFISFSFCYYFIRISHSINRELNIFLKIIFIFNTISLIVFNDYTPKVLSVQFISSDLFFTYVNGMFLNLSLSYLIPFFTAITLIHMIKATMNNIVTKSLFGCLKAFNVSNSFSSLIALAFFVLIYYYSLKAKRELWALFDSFKKSYVILDELIFKENLSPSFVLSKNFSILSMNANSISFLSKLKDNKLKGKKGFNNQIDNCSLNSNLLDYINPRAKEEFIIQFNKCIGEKLQKFYFKFDCIKPLCKSTDINSTNNDNSNTNDYYNNSYYKILPSRCMWKNQECYFVRICQEIMETSFYNYIFSYSKYLIEELFNLIQNSDKICERLINSEIKYEQYTFLLNKLHNRNISGNDQDTFNKIISQKVYIENNTILFNNDGENDDIKQTQNPVSNNNHFFNKGKEKNRIDQLFPKIDHSILFYFKNQYEVFYDLQLTKEVYTSILLQTPIININLIDLHSLANNFEDYFYMILRIKQMKLKFVIKCDCNISVDYSYIRTILFNTLMCIYNNTEDDSNDKSIIYTITLEKEPKVSSEVFDINYMKTKGYGGTEGIEDLTYDLFGQNNTHILRFSIIVWDDKQKENYNDILKGLQFRSQNELNVQEEIDKVKRYDIGLITLFYLINVVYSKELEMYSKEGEHTISFEIGCGIANKEDTVMQFDEIDSNVSDGYYKELLRKVFNITIPEEELKKKRSNNRFSKSLFKKPFDKKTFKHSISQNHRSLKSNDTDSDFSIAFSDTESPKENKDVDTKKDKTKLFIVDNWNFKPKQPKSLLSTKSLRINTKVDFNFNPSYFNPPKFLIVEDNQFARNQLINLIIELNKDYQIVIAEDGNVAMNKLKGVYKGKRIFDIVFMDMNLPYKNGIDIAKSIRNTEKDYPLDLKTKIIAISIDPNEKFAESALFDYYSKH